MAMLLPRYKIELDGAFTTVIRTNLPADGYEVFEHFADAKNNAAKWCGDQAKAYQERSRYLRNMKSYEVKK